MEGDDFEFGFGPGHSGFSMFLSERVKHVCFVRHAQGFHNVAEAASGNKEPFGDMKLWDAKLTPEGIQQCLTLRKTLAETPFQGEPFTHFDLVVVSPLTRALETAHHVFGPCRIPGEPTFMSEKFELSRYPRPHFLVREECRERYGTYTCDGRRKISEIVKEFPHYDFSEIEHDEDVYWTANGRESNKECMERAVLFLEWLNKRPEKAIAVVSHGWFLRHLFAQFGGDQSLDDKDRLHRSTANCEHRSVVLCSHGVKDGRELSKMRKNVSS
jgi:broad specificity phosphatase PhoE